MMATLYIGGLEPNTQETQLREWFGDFGQIADARVVTNDQGECRGFAYITFESPAAAGKARAALDGKQIGEATLRVAIAT